MSSTSDSLSWRGRFSGATKVARPAKAARFAAGAVLTVVVVLTGGGCTAPAGPPVATQQKDPDPACDVVSIERASDQAFRAYAPDGHHFAVSAEDNGGVPQLYLGVDSGPADCVSCRDVPGGPARKRAKMQVRWHPSGRWLTVAVERDHYSPPPVLGWSDDYVEGQLQNGLWTDMWAVSADGKTWRRLTNFGTGQKGVGEGYTGPVFTPDGRTAVWSQAMDGNVLRYWPFGRWQLTKADVVDHGGLPTLVNVRDITPQGMFWNEPGNIAPDGRSLLISGSTAGDAQGMDQYILDMTSGRLTNLNNSPTVWDEHGVFSPDGRKVVFMSAYPYRNDPSSSKVASIRTEFMLMPATGGEPTQLTHFRTGGYPESSRGIAAVAEWSRDGTALVMRTLVFPNYEDFRLTFAGPCGLRGSSGGG